MISTRWFAIGFRRVATMRPEDGHWYTTYTFQIRVYLRPWRRYA